MESEQFPLWQKEIAEIIHRKFPDDSSTRLKEKAAELTEFLGEVVLPDGDMGTVVALVLNDACQRLVPLSTAYVGFQLGQAYEKLHSSGT